MTENFIPTAKDLSLSSITERTQRKDPLSDEAMGNFLAALGNHEAKALLLVLMHPKKVYSQKDLNELLKDRQGEFSGWNNFDKTIPFGYCKNSLAPIGLVAKEYMDQEGIYGYEVTNYGRNTGVPLAGLLLDFSLRHDVSLYQLMGSTNSTSDERNRSPQSRLEIYWQILTAELPVRAVDLEKDGDNHMLGKHLRYLGRTGIISYETRKSGAPLSILQLNQLGPKEEPRQHPRTTTTKEIYDIFRNFPDKKLTIMDVCNTMIDNDPTRSDQTSLYNNVINVINNLKRQGYVTLSKLSEERQSVVNLTDNQRVMLEEFVTIIEGFKRQDPPLIARGNKLAKNILSNPQTVAALMKKAKENSPRANSLPLNETLMLIQQIIFRNPGTTNNGIGDLLRLQGLNLSEGIIQQYTRTLATSGKISVEKGKVSKKFFISETD